MIGRLYFHLKMVPVFQGQGMKLQGCTNFKQKHTAGSFKQSLKKNILLETVKADLEKKSAPKWQLALGIFDKTSAEFTESKSWTRTSPIQRLKRGGSKCLDGGSVENGSNLKGLGSVQLEKNSPFLFTKKKT